MHAGDPLTEVAYSEGARAVLLGEFMPGQQYLVAQSGVRPGTHHRRCRDSTAASTVSAANIQAT